MFRHFSTIAVSLIAMLSQAKADEPALPKTDLRVAIFAFLPNTAAALERLESAFEGSVDGKDIDVDFELFDPYQSADDPTKVRAAILDYDIVEIDLVRLDDLLQGEAVIEPLPMGVAATEDQCVAGAKSVAISSQGQYLLPHWVCGQFFVVWTGNKQLECANSFCDILCSLDHCQGRPLLTDFAGSTGLGEFYADAVLDVHGPSYVREHLKSLSLIDHLAASDLDPQAVASLKCLYCEIPPQIRASLGYFHDYSPQVYPFQFSRSKGSALLGYSERMYYVQSELALSLEPAERKLEAGEILVRQFPFSDASQGTPTWVDGFVIPKGRLAEKGDAIQRFLQFSVKEEGYVPFIVPSPWPDISSYLLPAHVNGYSDTIVKTQPVITQFRDASSVNPFTINESQLWRGIRRAGKVLEKELGIE